MHKHFRNSDACLTALLSAVTVLLFWPVFIWIARETLTHEQLRQSLALMFFAAVFAVFDQWGKLRPVFELNTRNLAFLVASFLLATSALLWPTPYTVLAALGLAVFALARIAFGSRALPVYLPFTLTFAAFLLFALVLPVADWPLRALAGTCASDLLNLFGFGTTLNLLNGPNPVLLMRVDGRIFEVAAECNGFGLMSTAVLLSLLLGVSQPMPVWWKAAGVLLAAAIGFAFNIARILAIVLAAPYFPDHYKVMHETIGLIALFGGLGLVWLLIGTGGRQPRRYVKA